MTIILPTHLDLVAHGLWQDGHSVHVFLAIAIQKIRQNKSPRGERAVFPLELNADVLISVLLAQVVVGPQRKCWFVFLHATEHQRHVRLDVLVKKLLRMKSLTEENQQQQTAKQRVEQ